MKIAADQRYVVVKTDRWKILEQIVLVSCLHFVLLSMHEKYAASRIKFHTTILMTLEHIAHRGKQSTTQTLKVSNASKYVCINSTKE